MFRILYIFSIAYSLLSTTAEAKDYKASMFGIMSDGVTLNTGSIQKAVNYISENGGGRLVFYVGRYLTGSVELKSNVTIQLEEGAVLVGIPSIYDYFSQGKFHALLYSEGQKNISLTGKGVIIGNGASLIKNRDIQLAKGYIRNTDIPDMPGLIQFKKCDSILISVIILMHGAGDIISFYETNQVSINGITIKNKGLPGCGLKLFGVHSLSLSDSYIQTSGIEITGEGNNQHIQISTTKNATGKPIKLLQQKI